MSLSVMGFLKTASYEFAESVLHGVSKYRNPMEFPLTQAQKRELLGKGAIAIEKAISDSQCDLLVAELERLLSLGQAQVWRDDFGSDSRFYGAEKYSSPIQEVFSSALVEQTRQAYTGSCSEARTVLAAKMIYHPENRGSGGGWHRDSPTTRQFKAIIYLDDVSQDNGPFEYLLTSHQKWSVLQSVLKGGQKFRQYRFSDSDIAAIQDLMNFPQKQFVAPRGTMVLVDTKGIHRGMPMKSGVRRALTGYFWDKKIPDSIGQYMN